MDRINTTHYEPLDISEGGCTLYLPEARYDVDASCDETGCDGVVSFIDTKFEAATITRAMLVDMTSEAQMTAIEDAVFERVIELYYSGDL